MEKTTAEEVVDFLFEFVPDALPAPLNSAVKAALKTWEDPRRRQQLISTARDAESDFRAEASSKLGNDELIQAIASFPLFDRELFQQTLISLPGHLNEDYVAKDLESLVSADWKGRFTPEQLRDGIAIYMACLRRRLLRVEGFADIITGNAILRIDERTATVQAMVDVVKAQLDEVLQRLPTPQARDQLAGDVQTSKAMLEQMPLGISVDPMAAGVALLGAAAPSLPDSSAAALSPDELRISGKLDQCKELFSSGNPATALKMLLRIESPLQGAAATKTILFRLNTLIGGCQLELRKPEEAKKRFEAAYELSPDNPKAIANYALTRLLSNDFESALQLSSRALEAGGTDTSALSVQVWARAHLNEFKNVGELVDEDNLNDKPYVRALGFIFLQADDSERAENYLRMALADDSTDVAVMLGICSSVLSSILRGQPRRTLDFLVEDEETRLRLAGVQRMLREALTIAEEGDNPYLVHDAIAMRASAEAISGNVEAAKIDCEKVLGQNPNHVEALFTKINISALEEKYDVALDCIERLPQGVRDSMDLTLIKTRMLVLKGDSHDALQSLESASTEAGAGDIEHFEILKTRAWALHQAGKTDDAERVATQLESLSAESAEAAEALGQYYAMIGNIGGAVEQLTKAFEASVGRSRRAIAIEIANLYFRQENYKDAIRYFELSEVDPLEDRALAQKVAFAAYRDHNLEKANGIAWRARIEKGINDRVLLEIESSVAETLGNVDLALTLDSKLAELEPKNPQHRINQARIWYRKQEQSRGLEILRGISYLDVDDPRLLMQMAQMYSLGGEPEIGLRIAYRAYRLGRNSPDILLAYTGLFLGVDEQVGGLNPDGVAPSTAVLLTNSGGSKWIVILEPGTAPADAWDFPVASDVAALLLGKTKGDKITFKSGPLENLAYTIENIQSVYVRAFQEIITDFGTRFPRHQGLQKMEIVGDDFTQFFRAVARMSVHSRVALEAYEAGALTIEQLAAAVGRDRFNVIYSMLGNPSSDPDSGIYASLGKPGDLEIQMEAAASATGTTLDLSSLITLSHLALLDRLKAKFANLYVPQHILDELDEVLAGPPASAQKGYSVVGYAEGRFFWTEISKEAIEQGAERVRQLISFIENNCEVLGISSEHGETALAHPDGGIGNVGKVASAAMLVARQTQTPLFSDDVRTRQTAFDTFGISGFWTQAFLRVLLQRGLLTRPDYADACVKLMVAGYHFVSVDATTIIAILERHQYKTNTETMAAISGLRGPKVTEDTAIRVGAEALRALWLSPAPPANRLYMLEHVMRALVAGRDRDVVVLKLITLVRNKFLPTGFHRDEIIKAIQEWKAVSDKFIKST